GLSLAEGKDVLHKPQPIFVAAQAEARPARCIARGVRGGRCRIGGAFMVANEWRRTAAYFTGGQIEPPMADHEAAQADSVLCIKLNLVYIRSD
ncbi:hypothetical protein PQQ99_39000, partial [Paraburkholderia sediminicola]|uniref:hypothetical protein n=1 Tax=Paraburkholderia sediminicola TaxID=458836 RepID=UPI0038B965B3